MRGGRRLLAGRLPQIPGGMQCGLLLCPLLCSTLMFPPVVASGVLGCWVLPGDCHQGDESWTTKVEDGAPGRAHSLCKGVEGVEGLALVEPSSG